MFSTCPSVDDVHRPKTASSRAGLRVITRFTQWYSPSSLCQPFVASRSTKTPIGFSLVRKEATQAAKSSSLMHPKAAFFKDKHNQTLVDHCKCSFLINLTNIVEVTITLLKTPMVFKKPLPTITLRSSTLYHPLPIPRIHALRDVTATAPKARNISHLPHSPQTSLTSGKTTRRREIGRCDVSHSA